MGLLDEADLDWHAAQVGTLARPPLIRADLSRAGVALSNIALTSNVVTIDTGAVHGLVVGDVATISVSTPAFAFLDGQTITVKTRPDTDTITADFTHANVGSAAAVGTLRATNKNLVIIVRGRETSLGADVSDATSTAVRTAVKAALGAVRVAYDSVPP